MVKKKDREVVGSMSEWAGMLKDFFRQIEDGTIELDQMRAIVGHSMVVAPAVIKTAGNEPAGFDFSTWLTKWENFYWKVFGRKYDFSGISIPQADNIFAWPVCMAGDISAEDWLSAGKNPPPFWKYTNKSLDSVLDFSFARDGWDRQYIVRLKANVEADDELKNISANKIAEMELNTMTLKERLAIGRFLYWDRRLVLDKKTWTLCSGSRYSGGSVPVVGFYDGLVRVVWYYPGIDYPRLRSRQAVS